MMGRFARFFLGLIVVGVLTAQPALSSPSAEPGDLNCPRAVPKLVLFNDASATGDIVKIGEAAHEAGEAYRRCMVDSATGAQEPLYNYDRTRLAQFLIVVGRALAAQHKIVEATAAFREARSEANDVAEWTPSSQVYSTSNRVSGMSADRNSNQRGSRYKEAAIAIRTAANEELVKLAPPTRPDSVVAPVTASPEPH